MGTVRRSPPGPEPRPALRKAADGALHPAMPRWEASAPAGPGTAPATEASASGGNGLGGKKGRAKKGKGRKGRGKHKDAAALVEVSALIPKSLRRSARRKAQDEGRTLDSAIAHLIHVWAGGGHAE